jgi:hypothetical protein
VFCEKDWAGTRQEAGPPAKKRLARVRNFPVIGT